MLNISSRGCFFVFFSVILAVGVRWVQILSRGFTIFFFLKPVLTANFVQVGTNLVSKRSKKNEKFHLLLTNEVLSEGCIHIATQKKFDICDEEAASHCNRPVKIANYSLNSSKTVCGLPALPTIVNACLRADYHFKVTQKTNNYSL